MALSLNNIRYGGNARRNGGTFRITENGIGWKSKQGRSISLIKEKLGRLEWISLGKGRGQLRIYTTEGKCHIYDGIQAQDLNRINDSTATLFDKNIIKQNLSSRGWNWGTPEFKGSFMNFIIDGKKAFDIPLSIVEQAHHDKNDVVIGFPQDSATSVEGSETMMEMRLWVPNTEESTSKTSTAENVLNSVLEQAEVLSAKGTGIVTFEQVVVKTPRGRYDLHMFSNFMRMKGTQSSTINYDCITRLTQLTTVDEKDRILIISLDPPLRRGHTSYPHLLMHFPVNQTLSVDLDLTKEQLRKYDGLLEEQMSGNKFELIFQVFRVITGIKATKSGNFKSISESNAVRCSLKANDGYLYPLAKCLIFIHSPITLIPFELISHIEFARLGATSQTNRTFDLVVFMKHTKQSTESNYIFNSINKDEYQNLERHLRSSGIDVRGTAIQQPTQTLNLGVDEEDEEDEDFSSAEEESDDEEHELEYSIGDAIPIDDNELSKPVLSDDEEEDVIPVLSDDEENKSNLGKRKKRPKTSKSPPKTKKQKL